MLISIISDGKILDNKAGYLSHVDDICEVPTLSEFAQAIIMAHITPAVFKDNKRCHSNVVSIQFASFDFDRGASSEKIHDQLVKKQINHVIAGSKNHLKDKGDGKGIIERFHVFIPLEESIKDIVLYKEIVNAMPIQNYWLDGTPDAVDHNCSDASRYFYKHSKILYVEDKYNNLALDTFRSRMILTRQIAAHKIEEIKKKFSNCDAPSMDQLKKSRWFTYDISPLLHPGSYHLAQLKMITFLKKLGYGKEDCVGFALDAKRSCKPEDYAKYCNTYDSVN